MTDSVPATDTGGADPEYTEITAAQPGRYYWFEDVVTRIDYVGEPYNGEVTVVHHMAGDPQDTAVRVGADWRIRELTDAELAEVEAASRRRDYVARLRALADLIEQRELPVDDLGLGVSVLVRTRAELRSVAEKIGAPAPDFIGRYPSVRYPVGAENYDADMRWSYSGSEDNES